MLGCTAGGDLSGSCLSAQAVCSLPVACWITVFSMVSSTPGVACVYLRPGLFELLLGFAGFAHRTRAKLACVCVRLCFCSSGLMYCTLVEYGKAILVAVGGLMEQHLQEVLASLWEMSLFALRLQCLGWWSNSRHLLCPAAQLVLFAGHTIACHGSTRLGFAGISSRWCKYILAGPCWWGRYHSLQGWHSSAAILIK